MTTSTSSDELDALFIKDTPLLDVRAPVEFAKGAFPTASNFPILNDDERQAVGICYKESGPDSAIELGHELVSGDIRDQRLAAWIAYVEQSPDAHLYCFRGGLRSQTACSWLSQAGIEVPRVEGGYKKLRNHLLSVYEGLPPLVIVSGQTGTGKTVFLKDFSHAVDLEGLANHRGSAFGRRVTPQPAQIDFENAVAIEFLKKRDMEEILLEDESRLIGRVNLPPLLQDQMKLSPILVVEESLAVRTDRIYDEYIVSGWQEYQQQYPEDGATEFEAYLLTAVDAIRKRLGGAAHEIIRGLMAQALAAQWSGNGLEQHRTWISTLLSDYYDPMYNYQIERKSERIRMRGTRLELAEWYKANPGVNR